MLRGYENWLQARRSERARGSVPLPFVAAHPSRVASARESLADLIFAAKRSQGLAMGERAFVPPRAMLEERGGPGIATGANDEPRLVGPIRLVRRPEAEQPAPRVPVLVRPAQLIRQSAFAPNIGQ